MSGHKIATITISQEEYRRLYEAEKKFEVFPNSQNLAVYDFEASPDESLFDQLNRLYSQRQSQFRTTENVNNSSTKQKEQEKIQKLVSQQFTRIQQNIEQITNNSEEQKYHQDKFVTSLADQVSEIREEISCLNQSLNLVHDQLSIPDFAQEDGEVKIVELDEYIAEIISIDKPQLIPESRFQHINEIRDECIKLFERGNSESALALLVEAVIEVREVWRQLHADLSLWEYEKIRLVNRLRNIQTMINDRPFTEAITRDGQITTILLDLREWSDQKYLIVQDDLNRLVDWYEVNQDRLDFTHFRGIEKSLQDLVGDYEEAVRTAHKNAINSQLKVDIARKIMFVLIDQGYRPAEGNYVNLDGNEGYFTQAENGEGSIVQVILEDDPRNFVGNLLSVYSLDQPDRTKYELESRAKVIRDGILETGLECSQMKEIIHDQKSTSMRRGDLKENVTISG